MYHHQTCDVKTMCYIVFISHSLHWHYIKTALQEYVINIFIWNKLDREVQEIKNINNFKKTLKKKMLAN